MSATVQGLLRDKSRVCRRLHYENPSAGGAMLSIEARDNVVTKIHPKIDAGGAKRVLKRVGKPSHPMLAPVSHLFCDGKHYPV
jgi:hypothetical protein